MRNQVTFRAVLCELEPPRGLSGQVALRVALARCRAARFRLAVQSVLCFGFGAALVPLAQYAAQELFNSGFYEYASILVSDRTFAMRYWQEFFYSLIESLPSLALLLLIACSIALIWSLRSAMRNSRTAFMTIASS